MADVDHDECGTKIRESFIVGAITVLKILNTMNTDHEAMETDFEKPGTKSQIRQRLDAEIDAKWADLILLGCFFCSGLIDSMAFNMYACFVSMQTGQWTM